MMPSQQPSLQPSCQPSSKPSSQPSQQPTTQPTMVPSQQPSSQPSQQPTMRPSGQPTMQPSGLPSCQPSSQPTALPSQQPSTQPSIEPSSQVISMSFTGLQPMSCSDLVYVMDVSSCCFYPIVLLVIHLTFPFPFLLLHMAILLVAIFDRDDTNQSNHKKPSNKPTELPSSQPTHRPTHQPTGTDTTIPFTPFSTLTMFPLKSLNTPSLTISTFSHSLKQSQHTLTQHTCSFSKLSLL